MQIYANLFKINETCYCSVISWPILILFVLLYTPYISRGFYFRESGASREFNNTQKYLPPIRTHECDLCTQLLSSSIANLTTRENVLKSRFAKN